MIPIPPEAVRPLLDRHWAEGPRLWSALGHAAARGSDGFWADDPARPRSIVLLRPGAAQLEAFALGVPDPAVAWLANRAGTRPVALLAPGLWGPAVRATVGPLERGTVETWTDCGGVAAALARPPAAVPIRRLSPADAAGFLTLAPPWATVGWGSVVELLARAPALGVPGPGGRGFAALAWVVERAAGAAALGVVTAPRFRRLGLGRAAASALLARLAAEGTGPGGVPTRPLWFTRPENEASRALARSLGLEPVAAESLVRWQSGRPGPEDPCPATRSSST